MDVDAGQVDAYRVALGALQRVAVGEGNPLERLTEAVDVVASAVGADVGLVVHAAPNGWDVRRLGSGGVDRAGPGGGPHLRVAPGGDPLLTPVQEGEDRVTTIVRQVGPGWLTSPRCAEVRRIWGVDQLACVPLRTGPGYVCVLFGRLGADYSDADLLVLASVQPVLAALNRLLDPDHLPDPAARVVQLTPREQRVLTLLSQGFTAARIAHHAEISPRTVHHHLANIYAKLGVGDRLSAVNRARSLGLIAPGELADADGTVDGLPVRAAGSPR